MRPTSPGIPVNLGPVHRYVLWLAIEDWYGLFELPDHDQIAPNELLQAPNRRAVVSTALDDLIAAGLVEVGVRPSMGEPPVIVSSAESRMLEGYPTRYDASVWPGDRP